MILSRDAAWALMTEHTQSESLRKHMLGVEAAVRGYARLWGEPRRTGASSRCCTTSTTSASPTPRTIRFAASRSCKAQGYPEWVTRAILSHADYSGVPRESRLEHTLFACDEMSGFVTAAALVRPSKSVLDLEASSVMKRMKDKAFARAVSRDDLRRGAEEIGLPLDAAHHERDRVHARARRRARALTRRRCDPPAEPRDTVSPYKLTTCDTTEASSPTREPPAGRRPIAVVQLDGVTVIYGNNRALKDVTRAVSRAGAVGLLGPNGAGKSTMLKALLGFVKPDRGAHDACSASTSRSARSRSARARLHAGERRAHSRHERRLVRRATAASSPGCRRSTRCSARTKCSTTSASARRATATSRPTRPA